MHVTRVDSKGGDCRPKPSKAPQFGGFAGQFAGQISIDHPLAPMRNGECIPEGRVGFTQAQFMSIPLTPKGESKTQPKDLRLLAEWLIEEQVEEVVTARYWKPLWGALER